MPVPKFLNLLMLPQFMLFGQCAKLLHFIQDHVNVLVDFSLKEILIWLINFKIYFKQKWSMLHRSDFAWDWWLRDSASGPVSPCFQPLCAAARGVCSNRINSRKGILSVPALLVGGVTTKFQTLKHKFLFWLLISSVNRERETQAVSFTYLC